MANGNYVSSVNRQDRTMDPIMQQMLYGLGGQGGFIQGAMNASNRMFFDEYGRPKVNEQQVAGFNPDQQRAFDISRGAIGSQQPFYQAAEDIYSSGLGTLNQGLGEVRDIYRQNMDARFDPASAEDFYNPYQQEVIDQTISDVMDQGAKNDMQATASNLRTAGESAYGSRAKLGAEERMEALGKGLGQSIGQLRSSGYNQAMSNSLGRFGSEQAARMGGAQGLSGAFGQAYGANTGYGGQMLGLGNAQAGSYQQDINSLLGIGGQQQNQYQNQLNAMRANQQAYDQAGMNQFNAIMPFMTFAGQQSGGPSTMTTAYSPMPSALQAGLATGLGTLGAVGGFLGQGQQQQQYGPYQSSGPQQQQQQPQYQQQPQQQQQPQYQQSPYNTGSMAGVSGYDPYAQY